MSAPALYLLDTNIVIHYSRAKTVGQRIEQDYGLLTLPDRLLICVVTRGEALAFALKRGWGGPKQAALNQLLAQFVTVDINDPTLIAAYAEVGAHSQSIGRKMGKNDLWVAAVACVSGAALMTTDADFDHLAKSHLTLLPIDQITGQTR